LALRATPTGWFAGNEKASLLISFNVTASVLILAGTRLFFATDIHGSESCFKKFVYASKAYKCDILIMGGDITGKKIIPIVKEPNGSCSCEWLGQHRSLASAENVERIKTEIRAVGSYPVVMDEKEKEELSSDQSRFESFFDKIMQESVREWVKYAESKLGGTKTRCYVQPGNDDALSIDEALSTSDLIINPEGKVIDLGEGFEMASTGYSNPTPWNCPRDIKDEELASRINGMIGQVHDLSRCVFNFHCPPYDSELDIAPQIDEQLNVIIKHGQMQMVPVGSKAVRTAIETHKPLLGLHGHIHESRGVFTIGRTTCINPGSEYSEGVLRGVIVNLDGAKVKSYQFTSG
jgi:Icc-related predicted phosphoesterase